MSQRVVVNNETVGRIADTLDDRPISYVVREASLAEWQTAYAAFKARGVEEQIK